MSCPTSGLTRPRIEIDPNVTIELKAEMFWGGKSQGSITRTIEHVCQRELNN